MRHKAAYITGVVFIALTIGVTTVSAIPVCQAFVTYTKKLVRNRVSPSTQSRWNAWNKTHPNFKPSPRPKYILSTKEVIQKIDFDCQMTAEQTPVSIDLIPMIVDTSTDMIESNLVPPIDIFTTPSIDSFEPSKNTAINLPITYISIPTSISSVSEPSSLSLILLGISFLSIGRILRTRTYL